MDGPWNHEITRKSQGPRLNCKDGVTTYLADIGNDIAVNMEETHELTNGRFQRTIIESIRIPFVGGKI